VLGIAASPNSAMTIFERVLIVAWNFTNDVRLGCHSANLKIAAFGPIWTALPLRYQTVKYIVRRCDSKPMIEGWVK
jgi:hypothetical protein